MIRMTDVNGQHRAGFEIAWKHLDEMGPKPKLTNSVYLADLPKSV
uniref:Uncharacterized protein n=1 Tax=Tetraselmis sp. GSL018 TaxID=582737 RepID=A0A061RUK5_9CHLO